MMRPLGHHLRFVAGVLLVASSAAVFAVAFRATLTGLYTSLYRHDNVVDAIASLPPWLRLAAPMAGGFLAGLIASLRSGEGQGVSNVMEAVALGRVQLSLRATGSRVASAWVAIAGGVSIGREGPLIETGGALGAAIGRAVGTPVQQTRVLIGVGTAAGFAAAYNTPFAAALFVLETISGMAAPGLVLPVMAGTVIAVTLTRAAVGAGPLYGQRAFGLDAPVDLIFVAGLGVTAALAAIVFKRLLVSMERWFANHPVRQPFRAMLGGLAVGTIAMAIPSVSGNGYEPLNRLLDAPPGMAMLLVLVVAKVVATSASVGSGIPGGIFTPMLLVGAALGSACSEVLAQLGMMPPNPGGYALVGMGAATAASIHAPLTAAVMIFEVSGDYAIVLPLVLATVVSTTVSRALGSESIYDIELRKKGVGWDITLEGRRLRQDAVERVRPSAPS
jgi:chloride channel protein, CIC family